MGKGGLRTITLNFSLISLNVYIPLQLILWAYKENNVLKDTSQMYTLSASYTTVKHGVTTRYMGMHMNQKLCTCGIHSHTQQFAILLLLIHKNYIRASITFLSVKHGKIKLGNNALAIMFQYHIFKIHWTNTLGGKCKYTAVDHTGINFCTHVTCDTSVLHTLALTYRGQICTEMFKKCMKGQTPPPKKKLWTLN